MQPMREKTDHLSNHQRLHYCFVLFCFFLSQHITNPRKAAGQQDLVVNNPLSQDEGVSFLHKCFMVMCKI